MQFCCKQSNQIRFLSASVSNSNPRRCPNSPRQRPHEFLVQRDSRGSKLVFFFRRHSRNLLARLATSSFHGVFARCGEQRAIRGVDPVRHALYQTRLVPAAVGEERQAPPSVDASLD
jgi:hypothetical protein